jgi:hypothetical protein
MNSKFIMLEKTNANQPASMRPAGENKGTCKSVSLLDASTFKVTLWSDKVFEGKVSVRSDCVFSVPGVWRDGKPASLHGTNLLLNKNLTCCVQS